MMSTRVLEPKVSYAKEDRLLDTERVFCAEYLANGFKGAAAARVAWPKVKDASAYALVVSRKPRVRKYLGNLLHKRIEEAGLSTDRILRQLEAALFLDPLDLFENTSIPGVYQVRCLDEIPVEVRRCINKVRTRTRETEDGDIETYIEIEFISKDKALELAMKYAGLLKESSAGVNVNVNNNIAINLDQLCSPVEAVTVDEEDDIVEQALAEDGK